VNGLLLFGSRPALKTAYLSPPYFSKQGFSYLAGAKLPVYKNNTFALFVVISFKPNNLMVL
jgi:hypothetical protein